MRVDLSKCINFEKREKTVLNGYYGGGSIKISFRFFLRSKDKKKRMEHMVSVLLALIFLTLISNEECVRKTCPLMCNLENQKCDGNVKGCRLYVYKGGSNVLRFGTHIHGQIWLPKIVEHRLFGHELACEDIIYSLAFLDMSTGDVLQSLSQWIGCVSISSSKVSSLGN